MESTRQSKVGRLIQKDVSAIIQRISKEIFQGTLITVTRVKVTPDLMMARVNISVLEKYPKKKLLLILFL